MIFSLTKIKNRNPNELNMICSIPLCWGYACKMMKKKMFEIDFTYRVRVKHFYTTLSTQSTLLNCKTTLNKHSGGSARKHFADVKWISENEIEHTASRKWWYGQTKIWKTNILRMESAHQRKLKVKKKTTFLNVNKKEFTRTRWTKFFIQISTVLQRYSFNLSCFCLGIVLGVVILVIYVMMLSQYQRIHFYWHWS